MTDTLSHTMLPSEYALRLGGIKEASPGILCPELLIHRLIPSLPRRLEQIQAPHFVFRGSNTFVLCPLSRLVQPALPAYLVGDDVEDLVSVPVLRSETEEGRRRAVL